MSNLRSTRRDLLKRAVGTGVGLAVAGEAACVQTTTRTATSGPTPPPDDAPAAPAPQPAASQPDFSGARVAFIGTGGIGAAHLESAHKLGVRCECYCDVDARRHAKAAELYPGARAYQDYRRLFDKERDHFDAVMIGIPDHQHFPATMMAMQLGKHVYTQKPLTHTPWEARQLALAARRHRVATQMGNQGHANEGWRLVYEWIHAGALGAITEVHTWTDRPIWPQGMNRPDEEDVPPRSLDWDVWLGPAPARPFRREAYHPFNWRGWWDFGAGALGDMACHTMDGVFWALDPGHPTAVEPVASSPMNGETFPKASIVRWEFAARGERPAFKAYWYDGGLAPPMPPDLEPGRRLGGTGNLFIGTKATLLVQGDYGDSPRIIPEAKMKEIGRPKPILERSPGHVEEWLLAVIGEKPLDFPKSNFAYAGPMTETILLGNIALRVGRRLEWDGPNLRFTNLTDANQFVTKEYRSGWKVV